MKYIFWIIFFYAGLHPASAQQDGVQQKKDSLINAKLNDQSSKVRQLSAIRRVDSLKRENLESQISLLKSSDQLTRAKLLKELASLKQGDSLQLIKQKHQVDSLKHFVSGFAVAPFRHPLFYIFTRQGSFKAKDRAEAVASRIRKLAADYNFREDSIKLSASEQTMDILYKDDLLISVSDMDALWQNTGKEKLATNLKKSIGRAVTVYRQETSWPTLIKEGLAAILVVAFVVMLIYGINRVFKLLLLKVKAKKSWYSTGIKIRNYELLNAEQEVGVLNFVIKGVKIILIVLTVYLALPILFGIFPFTKDLSATLIGYVTTPLKKIALGVWNYIPNLMTILVLVVIFRYVLKFFRSIKTEIETGRLVIPGFYADWATPTYQILRILVLSFMLIVIFPYMPGSDSPVFKGVSVFLGVLFTFGSAGALGNIVAGLVLTYMRSFKSGDRVKIGEVTGDILGRTLLVTRIRTIQNEVISIPNSMVMNNYTTNYSTDATTNGLIVYTTVTIGYDVPWRQIHQLLTDAAFATPMIEVEPKPYVLQTSLDDYYVSYRINAFTKEPNKQAVIYSALHQNIQDQFNKAGVEIMSPHYNALRNGNATAIPAEYLKKEPMPADETTGNKAD